MDSHLLDALKPILIAAILLGVFVVLPIVAMLLEHQRKMAAILHGKADEELRSDVKELRRELRALLGESSQAPAPEQEDDGSQKLVVGVTIGKLQRHTRKTAQEN